MKNYSKRSGTAMAKGAPKKKKKKKMMVAAKTRAARTADASVEPNQPVVVEIIAEVHAFYFGREEAEQAAGKLKRAGFPLKDISVSFMTNPKAAFDSLRDFAPDTGPDREDLGGTAARIAGGILGVGSVLVAAPIIVALSALERSLDAAAFINVGIRDGNQETAKRAAKVLLDTGGRNVGSSARYDIAQDDLDMREYRDETGRIHHHTHTYLRDHPDATLQPAA